MKPECSWFVLSGSFWNTLAPVPEYNRGEVSFYILGNIWSECWYLSPPGFPASRLMQCSVLLRKEEMEKGGKTAQTRSTICRFLYCSVGLIWHVSSILCTVVTVFNCRTEKLFPCLVRTPVANVSNWLIQLLRSKMQLDVGSLERMTVVLQHRVVVFCREHLWLSE